MIPVVWSDLSAWGAKGARRTLGLSVCGFALAGALTMLRPEICLQAVVFAALLAAFHAGKETWSEVASAEWVRRTGLSPGGVIAGRLLAAVLIAAAHLLLALPLVTLISVFWGMPWAVPGWVVLSALLGACAAAALGQAGTCLSRDDDAQPATALFVAWLILTAVSHPLRRINPFLQVWSIVTRGGFRPGHLLGSLAGVAVVVAAACLALRWQVKGKR